MKGGILSGIALVVLTALVILGYSSAFIVHQTQQALVLRLGEPVRVITQPGLAFKVPFVDSVTFFDNRVLDLDAQPQEVIASDQKRLVVDAFARYRISNALRFFQTVGTVQGANSRLSVILNSAVRRVLGEATFTQLVRDDRAGLMSRIRQQVTPEAQNLGVEIVDVRIRRADLPEANSQAVFERMKTERQREANEIRAQGREQSQRITARADRDVTVLIGEANAKGEQVRGEGDAERNRIFAEAFGRDPDFFTFYRSMQAYEAGLKAGDTRMILAPDSAFFRYFGDPAGGRKPEPGKP
ncbi:protease modulator HflC [Blastochloris tepida]|uniref:Protein HflC n=1 Tax=Blastochloris tepida TaxID=2233851 RepID=A0A348FVP9_9HYPH|nr:protease modulator HflC [Blastochloris tepida]BBF91382.1 protein HflC [Blastochloris tepida]